MDTGSRPPDAQRSSAAGFLSRWNRRWCSKPRGERLALGLLAIVVAAGVGLRLVMMLAWRPALLGYSDVQSYLWHTGDARFLDPLHPGGYSIFIELVHAAVPKLAVLILVQHGLGVSAGLLLYAALRHADVPAWAALVPTAVVLLTGLGILLEHTPLSESLFIFLVMAGLYASVRVTRAQSLAWALLAGALIAAAGVVRTAGLPLVVLPCLAALITGAPWIRARAVLAAVIGVVAVLGGYVVAQHAQHGITRLTSSAGPWNLYGRAARFADCTKFTPPPGTHVLCDSTLAGRRLAVSWYVFAPDSPAVQAFGLPFFAKPEQTAKVEAFARAAIIAQPLDYLAGVGDDFLRYVDRDRPGAGGAGHDAFIKNLYTGNHAYAENVALGYFTGTARGTLRRESLIDFMNTYARTTRLDGIPTAIAFLLSFAAPFAPRGRIRQAGALFFVAAWILILVPVMTNFYAPRTALPALGPLFAAAAIGAVALSNRWGGHSWASAPRPGRVAPPNSHPGCDRTLRSPSARAADRSLPTTKAPRNL